MHVPPLIKAHHLSVLLTGQKNKSRRTGSMFYRTADVSNGHLCKVIWEGFWAEKELNIKSNYMVLLLVLLKQRIREGYHLPDLSWDQKQSYMVMPLMAKFCETVSGLDVDLQNLCKDFLWYATFLVLLELSKLIETCVTDSTRMILKTNLVADSKL